MHDCALCVRMCIVLYLVIVCTQYGNMAIWQYGNTAIWQYGNTAIRQYGNTAVRAILCIVFVHLHIRTTHTPHTTHRENSLIGKTVVSKTTDRGSIPFSPVHTIVYTGRNG